MPDKTNPDKANEGPIELDSDNPSQNSRLHAATKFQSSVKPEDYPARTRQAQTDAATGQPGKRPAKD